MKISIDFETYLISDEMPIPKPVCLSYFDGHKGDVLAGPDMAPFLQSILESDATIIAHNATFELLVIYEHFPKLRNLLISKLKSASFVCTLLKEKLLNNIAKSQIHKFDLASLTNRYLGIDISETKTDPNAWRLRYAELDGISVKDYPKEAYDYALQDSIYTYHIFELQNKKGSIQAAQHVLASFALNLSARRGLYVDKQRVATLKAELERNMSHALTVLEEAKLIEYKKGKYTKKAKAFREYIEANSKDPKFTEKGIVATSADVLIGLTQKQPNEIIESWLTVMQCEKVISSFVKPLESVTTVVRTEYEPIVSSGRTSSRGSRLFPSMNIQQLPREVKNVSYDVRNCIVPRPGYKICSIDYSGLELSSTAHQLFSSGCGNAMLDILNKGDSPTDLHSMLASKIMTIKTGNYTDYDTFVKHKKESEYKAYRQIAKPLNLGFPGGIGYDTMHFLLNKEGIFPKLQVIEKANTEEKIKKIWEQFRFEYPELRIRRTKWDEWQLVYDELKLLKRAMFDLYPDLEYFLTYKHKTFIMLNDKKEPIVKPIKNEFGETEWEPMYAFETMGVKRAYCTYTAFCNGYLMQTPSAAGAKSAFTAVQLKYIESEHVRPLAFIHDEIVFEIKESPDMYEYIQDVAEIMIDEMQKKLYSVRIAVEAEVFDCWKKSGGDWVKSFWKNKRGDALCKK
jgi:DNA polymerase I-like protein with 3'-5' exonuclease and polymerase domains